MAAAVPESPAGGRADAPADPPPGVPLPDAESLPFWRALSEHRIVVQECSACGRRRAERMPGCPWCGSPSSSDVEASGTGVVYSWVRVHRPLGQDAAVAELPYTVAAVDLDGGGRVFGRLEPAGAAATGLAVTARFVDHDGWTELRFGPR